MIISIIVAMDERGGIGIRNQIPWHIPADLKRFKSLTMGHHLIVGRKTFESIGRILPGRTMIIVTRGKDYQAEGCLVARSLHEALNLAEERGESEVFITGGGTIYSQAMPFTNRAYITRVHSNVEADVFFSRWESREWRLIHQEDWEGSDPLTPAHSFYIFERTDKIDQ